ncbi:sce7725 family protein [Pseudomonas protegens]|uniref:sce7725 family protein n=1 Tax=Pseudomonas protegens TaxID=380021 RepID=UPI00274E09F7|nr:sce7725 family protein [Pseudomonas protegens]MDP9533955.1 sce7725 family protein [Pseudomonas protegens]
MYYPILKGKQYELAALKELVEHIPVGNVCPILEPVNSSLVALATTIIELTSAGITSWVVINPSQGEFVSGSGSNITRSLASCITTANKGAGVFVPCVKVRDASDVSALALLRSIDAPFVAYVEGVITPALSLDLMRASVVALNPEKNVQSIWSGLPRVVLFHDGFDKKSRNLDYGVESFYSDFHIQYRSCPNAIGFGDYTVLGERFIEGGGPAYVVTLHLSYLDDSRMNGMYVRHFSSYSDNYSQSDPGGKFREALDLLVSHVSLNPTKFVNTAGLQDFFTLHASRHFPNLGVVKKISIKHHIQTLSGW